MTPIRINRGALICAAFILQIGMLISSFAVIADEASAPSIIEVLPDVPKGFEFLTQPQETVIDVYYGDQLVTDAKVVYAPGIITLDTPERIVSKIRGLNQPNEIIAALSGEIPSHPELVCNKGSACDFSAPDEIMVIFNEDRFRLDILIPESFLSLQTPYDKLYLPSSDSHEVAFAQSLDLTFAGDVDDSPLFTLQGSTLIGKEERRIKASWVSTEDAALVFDELNVSADFNGHYAKIGLFEEQDRALSLLQNQTSVGAKWGNSLDLRDDAAANAGSTIELFLATAANVDIFKDGRLLDTRYYGPGNQVIDTSRLPDGAYDITLRVREMGGEGRSETRFFVKSGLLPPPNVPLYFASLSQRRSIVSNELIPASEGPEWELRAGYSRRLKDSLGVDVGAVASADEVLMEAGVYKAYDHLDIQAKGLVSTNGDSGAHVRSTMMLGSVGMQVDWRKINGKTDPALIDRGVEAPLLRQNSEQFDVRIQKPMLGGRVSFVMQKYALNGVSTDTNYQLMYEKNKRLKNAQQLRLFAEGSMRDSDWQVRAGLEWRFGKHSTDSTLRATYYSEDSQEFGADSYIQTDASLVWESDLERARRHRVSFDVASNKHTTNYQAQHDYAGHLGTSRLSLQHQKRSGSGQTSYSGHLSTRIISNGNYTAVGAKGGEDSAIIVDVKGAPSDKAFIRVLIDDQPKVDLSIGRKSIVPLPPYKTYKVRFKAIGDEFIALKEREYEATIYPANVIKYDVNAASLHVLIGRITDEGGEFITNEAILGGYGLARTDSDGYFQAEVYSGTDFLYINSTKGPCRVSLPKYEVNNGIGILENLFCLPIEHIPDVFDRRDFDP